MSHRQGLFGGVAVLSAGTVALQIALTRLYSALFGHHFAFVAISLALFGAGAGGVLLYVFPWIASPPRLLARLAYLACLAAACTVGGLLVLLHIKPIDAQDTVALGSLAAVYLSSSAPFVVVGIAIAAAIRHACREMSRLYLVDLAGAAAGGLVALAALRAGAPRACLVVAILDAVAAIAFYLGARARAAKDSPDPDAEERVHGGVVAAAALATCVLLAGDLGSPWLKLPSLRWAPMDKVEFQAWNELALITVEKPAAGTAWMRIDGSAATAILDPKTTPPLHPDEMAYVLHRDKGPVLVIGAGGGRDVRAALKNGQKDIHAVEINPIIVDDVMRGRYKAFSGELYDKPEVHVTVADGRSYVRSSKIAFRNIELSLVDTWAAASGGALALTEDSLYTVEAFRDYLDHLDPAGTLVVNRWDNEFDRLLGLGAAGLLAVGAKEPQKHFFACSAARTTTLLVKRTPLSQDEIGLLRGHCRRNKFDEVFAPDQPHTEARRRIAEGMDPRRAVLDSPTDLSPPTDDRPFFFYGVPARRLGQVALNAGGLKAENQGLLTILSLLVVSFGLAVAFLLGPLALRRRPAILSPEGAPLSSRLGALLFFACIGAGFVLVEVSLIQQFVMFLGHPVHALSTVLVVLLLSAGLGSFSTARVDASLATLSAGRRAQLLVALLAILAVLLGPLLERLLSLPFAARLAMTVLLLAPLGALMGALAPLGVKILSVSSPELIPWCWGLSGVAGVVATAIGTIIALQFGFGAVLLAGGASYLVAASVAPGYSSRDQAAKERARGNPSVGEVS